MGVQPVLHVPAVGKGLRDVAQIGVCAKTDHPTLTQQLRTPWPYLR